MPILLSRLNKVLKILFLLSGTTMSALGGDFIHDLAPFEVVGSRLGERSYFLSPAHEIKLAPSVWPRSAHAGNWGIMEGVPGLHVEQAGSNAGNASLFIRGGEANFGKILVDGIEVNNPNSSRGGSYDFNSLSFNAIERVSILEGAQSAIHGSDALSGVVWFQTLSPDLPTPGFHTEANVDIGSDRFLQTGAMFSAAGHNYHLRLGGSRLEDNFDRTGETFMGNRFNGGLLFVPAENIRLYISGLASNLRRSHFPDDSGGFLYAAIRQLDFNESRDAGAQGTVTFMIRKDTTLVARLSWYEFRSWDDSPGIAPGKGNPSGIPANYFEGDLRRMKAEAYVRHVKDDGISLAYGLAYKDEKGGSISRIQFPFGIIPGSYDLENQTGSVFVEGAIPLSEHHSLELAIRGDSAESNKLIWSKRAGYLYSLPEVNTGLRIIYGEGFKEPSFFALGNPLVGNPDLKPESSDLLEIGFAWHSSNESLRLDLSAFRQEFTDLIDLSESYPPQLVNLSSVRSSGFTGRLSWSSPSRFYVDLHATWMNLEVSDPDELVRGRPDWRAGLSFSVKATDSLRLRLNSVYVGEQVDFSIQTGEQALDAYVRSDLALEWTMGDRFRASLAIENLWNSAYQVSVGFPQKGRWFRFGAGFTY